MTAPMRVLQVNTFVEEKGGAEIYMHTLARSLAERGHEVALFGGHPEDERDEPLLCVVRRPDFVNETLFGDEELAAQFRAFRDVFRPDIVHVHNLYSFPSTFATCVGEGGIPVVQTLHDLSSICTNVWCVRGDGSLCPGGAGKQCFEHGCEANAPFDGSIVGASYTRLRVTRAFFDAFLAPSAFMGELFGAHGFGPIHVVPHFVDATSRREPVEPDPNHILYAGRLELEKGLAVLLDAMPRILERVPGARLTIVGGGTQAGALAEKARPLGNRVRFTGRIPHAEVTALMAGAWVGVVPSIWREVAGLSVLEGMAEGLPSVASRIGGLSEAIEDGVTGLLAEPRDPADLADKVVRLLSEPGLRRGMAARGREVVAGRDRETHMARVEAVYEETVAAGPTAPRELSPADRDAISVYDGIQRKYAWFEKMLAQRPEDRLRSFVRRGLDRIAHRR